LTRQEFAGDSNLVAEHLVEVCDIPLLVTAHDEHDELPRVVRVGRGL
jgi:hypothetical protein